MTALQEIVYHTEEAIASIQRAIEASHNGHGCGTSDDDDHKLVEIRQGLEKVLEYWKKRTDNSM